jgi:transposase
VFQLPSYAPELNPQEGVWSVLKRGLADVMKRKLKRIQYRPELSLIFMVLLGSWRKAA